MSDTDTQTVDQSTPDAGSSNLGAAIAGTASPDTSTPDNSPAPSSITLPAPDPNNTSGPASASQPAQPQSRLSQVLSAVAKVGSTAIAATPQGGRPSFLGGLGAGARAEQASQAAAAQQQQDIKFRSFDDQVRLSQLHAQDQEQQNRNQAQQDAHEAHMQTMSQLMDDFGIEHDTVPNNGAAAIDYMKTQTAGNGAVAVPPGTHISGDGKSILIPKDTPETDAGQLALFKAVGPALGLNANIPSGATKLSPQLATVLYNKLQGYGPDGHPYTADQLPALIAGNQQQLSDLKAKGAPQPQIDAVTGIIAKQKAHLQADQDALNQATQRKTQATIDVNNAKAQNTKDINAAKPQKPAAPGTLLVGSDQNGNQIAGTQDELNAAGATGVTKLDNDTGKKVITARQLISPNGLFAQIRQDIDNLGQKGLMGSSAQARFQNALLEKGGTDPDFAPLFVHTHLLSTALMQAHVGSRGSSDMMEEFKSLANAGKMSAPTLKAALGAEYSYVHEKAMLPKKQAAAPAQPATQPNGGQ